MMIYDATTRRCFVWLEQTIGSKGKMNRNKYSRDLLEGLSTNESLQRLQTYNPSNSTNNTFKNKLLRLDGSNKHKSQRSPWYSDWELRSTGAATTP